MKRRLLAIIMLCLAFSAIAQKSKVMAVGQMIDAEKYDEAKEAIELALVNDKTSKWPRTYYTKGLLCQTAYEAGVKSKDSKKINLYPDQLYLAFDSYEKALELDLRGRLHSLIGQKYYLLANDFRVLGEERYLKGEYEAALTAFENALLIGNSELISAKTDTSLIYNAAMAAYEGQNWEKAINYLSGLHKDAYSPSASLLLAISYEKEGDTLLSEEVLMEGLDLYNFEDSIVMYLVNQMVGSGRLEPALDVLDKAIEAQPGNYRYYWAKGLVYRRMNKNEEAIKSFLMADERSPESALLCYHIGICYYNMGIELRESAMLIQENSEYAAIRRQYLDKFREAVKWFEKSYRLDPSNKEIAALLYQLYDQLQMREEQESLRQLKN
jgi:tetratricopeptide (TPR) repeat protein